MIWWMLQNFLVIALLAGCVWMICRIARPGPAMQHALWLVLLIKLVTPPVLPWPWAVEDLIAGAGLKETIVGSSFIAAQPGVVARETAMKPNDSVVPEKEKGAPIPAEELLLLVAASVWLTGSGLFIFVQAEKVHVIRALLKGSRPASPVLRSLVEDVAGYLKTRPIAARVTSTIASPFIWCIRRPLLLWPEALSLADESVRGLLVHELAHVKRRDHWVGWLELAAGCLWWWNPLYWCIRRQLRETAELACDAWVVSSIESAPNGRRAYAEALLSVCESMPDESRRSSPILAMGANTGDRRFLERRLTMILRDHRPFRLSRIGVALIAFVFAGTLPAWTLRATPEPAPSSSATTRQVIPPRAEEAVSQTEIREFQLPPGRFLLSQDPVVSPLEAAEIALNVATGEVLLMSTPDRTFTHELMAYRGLVGQTIHLHLRGAMRGGVWGTDIYTDDSDPNAAAVHAGLLKPGEEGIAAIRLLPGIERYDGTTRNGVQSNDFGHFRGSYRFEGVQPVAKPDASEMSVRLNVPFVLFLDGIGGDAASSELIQMRNQIGATIDLTVTGSNSAPIWGDGIYTDDSAVAVAAVHAGLLKVGEIGVVRATIMPPQDRYPGTTRNGVQSQSFGRFEGSYRLERVKP
jgi:beta-lactamase regulating signal transducer with metallopeptidase domain